MGYDFELMRLRADAAAPRSRALNDLREEDVAGPAEAAPLRAALAACTDLAPGTVTPLDEGFRWRTPDGGLLDVRVSPVWIHVDTHAHWDHVARLFELARTLWPDLWLLDLQKGRVHDPQAFREFVAASYRQKASGG